MERAADGMKAFEEDLSLTEPRNDRVTEWGHQSLGLMVADGERLVTGLA